MRVDVWAGAGRPARAWHTVVLRSLHVSAQSGASSEGDSPRAQAHIARYGQLTASTTPAPPLARTSKSDLPSTTVWYGRWGDVRLGMVISDAMVGAAA